MTEWRLFLDQNLRYEIQEMLHERGVDTLHASDVGLQRALDPDVFQLAIEQRRTFVTHDTEFGDLNIFPLPAHHIGVIRLKVHPPIGFSYTRRRSRFVSDHYKK